MGNLIKMHLQIATSIFFLSVLCQQIQGQDRTGLLSCPKGDSPIASNTTKNPVSQLQIFSGYTCCVRTSTLTNGVLTKYAYDGLQTIPESCVSQGLILRCNDTDLCTFNAGTKVTLRWLGLLQALQCSSCTTDAEVAKILPINPSITLT